MGNKVIYIVGAILLAICLVSLGVSIFALSQKNNTIEVQEAPYDLKFDSTNTQSILIQTPKDGTISASELYIKNQVVWYKRKNSYGFTSNEYEYALLSSVEISITYKN